MHGPLSKEKCVNSTSVQLSTESRFAEEIPQNWAHETKGIVVIKVNEVWPAITAKKSPTMKTKKLEVVTRCQA